MKKYDVIVFDLGNTLIRFDHNISAGKLADHSKLDTKKIYDLFFDSENTRLFEKGLVSAEEFHRRMSAVLEIDLPYDEFIAIWNNIFWEDEAMCGLARQLKKRYKLFLLSNICKSHFEHIKSKFNIIKIFDEVIPSYMVGAMKPDKAIFDHTVKLAGGDKSKLLYIDDREDLIKEAQALGIDSIRFEGVDKLKSELSRLSVI